MSKFSAVIEIIGINPFVAVPDKILKGIFRQAGRDKGPVPIRGTINGKAYQQTLVKYRSSWRLYINNIMLQHSPKRIGETIEVTIEFDPSDRTITPHPKLVKALSKELTAKKVFDELPPSAQKEIAKYIASLKTEESIDRNVRRAIDFLLGKGRFIGRNRP
jgi:hypothetical protein